mgnify:FL=1
MENYKLLFTIAAVILTVAGYVPYLKDTFAGKTKPHVFSWFIWGILTAIIFALQLSAGAGFGSYVTLALAILSFFICAKSFREGDKHIKKIDVVFLVFALAAIPLWLVIKQPVLSMALLSAIDMLAFIPTIRKSWHDPYSETLSFFVITIFRHGLSIIALAEYNLVTYLFPLTWVFANGLFALMLIIRRKYKE